MQKLRLILTFITTVCCWATVTAQKDSSLEALQEIPTKYISIIDKKITTYSNRVSSKTIKTLTKLSRWETKVKGTLQKLNPDAANKLFGNNQLTFASLLQKIQQGEAVALQYHQQYDKYRDDLTTNIKYLEKQKAFLDSGVVKKLSAAKKKIQELNAEEDSTDAIQQFIKERKKQLISTAFKYMGNSRYLSKINKETWYYAETIRNYKELFNDEEKLERTAKEILNKVPGFSAFVKKNSMLASLFGAPGDIASATSYVGLQTRASVQGLIQERIAGGGPNAQQIVSQNMQAAQAQLNEYKDKLLKSPTGSGDMPDFKPNLQKTKTFKQRLEFGSDFQFAKSNTLMPTTMDLAFTAGYKLNDKSVAGIGAAYKMGLGSIDRIRFSTQGLSLRSFIDWKLKKSFFITGGWEMNYLSVLPPSPTVVKYNDNWQQSALAGISKKIKVKTKWFKQTKLQLLYDFLAKQHLPVSQPLLFRVGYNF